MIIKEILKDDDNRPYVIYATNECDNMQIRMKWDGCIDITRYSNGATVSEHDENSMSNYMHICEVKEFIKELQSVVEIAEKEFGEYFDECWS